MIPILAVPALDGGWWDGFTRLISLPFESKSEVNHNPWRDCEFVRFKSNPHVFLSLQAWLKGHWASRQTNNMTPAATGSESDPFFWVGNSNTNRLAHHKTGHRPPGQFQISDSCRLALNWKRQASGWALKRLSTKRCQNVADYGRAQGSIFYLHATLLDPLQWVPYMSEVGICLNILFRDRHSIWVRFWHMTVANSHDCYQLAVQKWVGCQF